MKFFSFFLLLLQLSCISYAQTISGRISDKSGKPVEFANVTLRSEGDSAYAGGSITDTAGVYSIEKVKAGSYIMVVTQVGFKKTVSQPFSITSGKNFEKNITIEQENVQLDEVVVQAQKSVVVQEPGKIVFNVENTVSSAGLMAIDLLKRMPGVQVDNNGNISIKGKSEVLFMIDGKPSYLSAKQIAVILRSLPSNQISNIEVITSPSAKYDAKGNAGIININLKKSEKKGVTGTLQTTLGHGILYKSNTGGSISAGLKKWQINAMYDLTLNRNLEEFEQIRNFGGAESPLRYYQTQHYEVPVENHNYRFSADYKQGRNFGFGVTHRGMYIKEKWLSTNTGLVTNQAGQTVQRILSNDNNPNHNSDLAIGGNIKYKIDTLGQELSADGEVSNFKQRSVQNIVTSVWNHDTLSTLNFHSRQPLDNVLSYGKIDYSKSFVKVLKLEAGYKLTSTEILNTVEYNVVQTGTFMPRIPPDNRFFYSEQINAGYLTLKWDSATWSVQLGLRAEHWKARGMLRQASFSRDSLQFFPNFQAKKKLSTHHEVAVAASRRVDRPNYLMLNPIAYYSDPYTYYVGNPRILPQSTYHTELSHNYKGGTIVTTINYSKTRNAINDYAVFLTSDTSKIQFMGPTNITAFENYGISSSLYFNIMKFWTSQAFLNVYRNHFYGQANRYNIDAKQTAWSATTTQSFILPGSWGAEINGNYSSPTIYGYTRNRAMGMISIGVKKEFLGGKLVTKLNFQDIFYTFQYRGSSLLPEFNSRYTYRWDNRVVSFSLVWKIEKNEQLLREKEAN